MYDSCEIFVTDKTKLIGNNLKELFKYIHIESKLNQTIINNSLLQNIKNKTLIFILYENQYLDKLNINITYQVYFFLLEQLRNKEIENYRSNIITIDSKNKHKFFVPNIPLPNDDQYNNIDNFFILKVLTNIFRKEINFDIIHNFAINYKYKNMKKVLSVINKDNKEKHRFICYQNINLISNIFVNEFGIDESKETILIEFRKFPHVEFLLRNIIHKLSKSWNHTIICGKENYDMMIEINNKICKHINSKIRIIKLEIDNLSRDEYCKLLTSSYFWNLFKGEDLLLYQEDTMVFHGNIEPFLKYDYIGAPWKKTQDDNKHHVGNGGFSFRKKSAMLRVINQQRNLVIGNSTKNYMKNSKLNCIPEDVYFSKSLIDFNLGNVSQYDDALRFSQESIIGNNPFAGHAFWLSEPKKKIYNVYKLNDSNYYKTVNHRGGWKAIITNLINNNIICNNSFYGLINKNILLIDIVEKYFVWEKRESIIEEEWVGIIHIVPETPSYLRNIQIENLLYNIYFQKSLEKCKGIIVLSNYLNNYLTYKLPNLKIRHIKHPTVMNDSKKFDIEMFKDSYKSNKLKVIQLGSQLRFLSSIYKIKTNFKKLWLPGRKDTELLFHWLNRECTLNNISINNEEMDSVILYYTNNFIEYDNIILNNIVVIHLINASANNAILELMYLNIPFFVNKLDAVIEYIGPDYPMYFSSLKEIETIINNKELLLSKYKETTNYLKNINKQDISMSYFNSEMLRFINE